MVRPPSVDGDIDIEGDGDGEDDCDGDDTYIPPWEVFHTSSRLEYEQLIVSSTRECEFF